MLGPAFQGTQVRQAAQKDLCADRQMVKKKLRLPGRYPPSSLQVVCDILLLYSRKVSAFPQQQTASRKKRTHIVNTLPPPGPNIKLLAA